MLLQQTGNGKRNGQFSELLISSGDTLQGGWVGGGQRAAVLCKWPTMLSAAGGGASVC